MDTSTYETSANMNIIYDRNESTMEDYCAFKPGRKPECTLGDQVLNQNMDWARILEKIIKTKKYTIKSLSQDLEVDQKTLEKISKNDVSSLSFKTGAKLLRVHSILGL